MIDNNFRADKFLSGFATKEYNKMLPRWEKCADFLGCERDVKHKGERYLFRTKKQSADGGALWNAYKFRGKVPIFQKQAYEEGLGVIIRALPTVVLPDDLEFFRDWGTAEKTGLEGVRREAVDNILRYGGGFMVLEPLATTGENHNNHFVIKHYNISDYLNADIIGEEGEDYAKFILVNESTLELDYSTKTRRPYPLLRVFGLDANNEYYQTQITPDMWASFDVDYPPQELAVYPMSFGKKLNRIPLIRYNVADLSLSPLEFASPVIETQVDLACHYYNCDARLQQTLALTSEPSICVTGGQGDERKIARGANSVTFLPEGYSMLISEFTGAGAGAQRQNLQDIEAMSVKAGLALSPDDLGNSSGVALEVIREAQTASLVKINTTSCNAIFEVLRLAEMWKNGTTREKANEKITYSPAEIGAVKLTTQELMELLNAILEAMRKNEMVPMTLTEWRKKAEQSGLFSERDIEEIVDELEEDIKRTLEKATPQTEQTVFAPNFNQDNEEDLG